MRKKRVKHYLPTDVYTEAKARLRHLYDTFDAVVVSFSGGKDSLATLHLAREVAQERGISQVDVLFRDEELIPDSVIDFVNDYRQLPWVRMKYFAIPLRSQKFILGRSYDYVQWDPNREHLRPIPGHAIRQQPGDTRVFDQYSADQFLGDFFPGKKAFLLGLRADESLMRFQGMLQKLDEPFIHGSAARRDVFLCKPIYDWTENDVFKYFYDHQIRYCPIYDAQHLAGGNLRVSTPLHAESAKRLGLLRSIDPVFYNRVLKLFPEVAVQDRYWSQIDTQAVVERYGRSLEGIRAYIDEEITDPVQHTKALEAFDDACRKHRREPAKYPAEYIFRYIRGGGFKRKLLPKVT